MVLVASPLVAIDGCSLWVFSRRFKWIGAALAIYSAGIFTGVILIALSDPGPTLH
jgi:hypothetical protein